MATFQVKNNTGGVLTWGTDTVPASGGLLVLTSQGVLDQSQVLPFWQYADYSNLCATGSVQILKDGIPIPISSGNTPDTNVLVWLSLFYNTPIEAIGGSDIGDMSTSVYDTGVNGIVDNSEALGGIPASGYESNLGLPGNNGQVLASTTGGTRSWVTTLTNSSAVVYVDTLSEFRAALVGDVQHIIITDEIIIDFQNTPTPEPQFYVDVNDKVITGNIRLINTSGSGAQFFFGAETNPRKVYHYGQLIIDGSASGPNYYIDMVLVSVSGTGTWVDLDWYVDEIRTEFGNIGGDALIHMNRFINTGAVDYIDENQSSWLESWSDSRGYTYKYGSLGNTYNATQESNWFRKQLADGATFFDINHGAFGDSVAKLEGTFNVGGFDYKFVGETPDNLTSSVRRALYINGATFNGENSNGYYPGSLSFYTDVNVEGTFRTENQSGNQGWNARPAMFTGVFNCDGVVTIQSNQVYIKHITGTELIADNTSVVYQTTDGAVTLTPINGGSFTQGWWWDSGAASGDVSGPASSVDNNFAQFDGTTGKLIKDGGLSLDDSATTTTNLWSADKIQASIAGAGGGDVTGPASSTSNNIATFNGLTGKIIQDGGYRLNDGGTSVADLWSASQIQTTIDAILPADMIFVTNESELLAALVLISTSIKNIWCVNDITLNTIPTISNVNYIYGNDVVFSFNGSMLGTGSLFMLNASLTVTTNIDVAGVAVFTRILQTAAAPTITGTITYEYASGSGYTDVAPLTFQQFWYNTNKLQYNPTDAALYGRRDNDWVDLSTESFNANALQDNAVATTTPTDGQILVWNNTASEWQPTTNAGSVHPLSVEYFEEGTVPSYFTISRHSNSTIPVGWVVPNDGNTYRLDGVSIQSSYGVRPSATNVNVRVAEWDVSGGQYSVGLGRTVTSENMLTVLGGGNQFYPLDYADVDSQLVGSILAAGTMIFVDLNCLNWTLDNVTIDLKITVE